MTALVARLTVRSAVQTPPVTTVSTKASTPNQITVGIRLKKAGMLISLFSENHTKSQDDMG
jgi:hypothetical protein